MDTMYLSAHNNLFKGTNRIIIGVKSGFIPKKSDYLCIEESKLTHIVTVYKIGRSPLCIGICEYYGEDTKLISTFNTIQV